MPTVSVPAAMREQVDRWARNWLEKKFSRLLELRAVDPGPFNYPVAVFSAWRGGAFYLCVRYRARTRKPEDDFIVRHTRMTLKGFGVSFALSLGAELEKPVRDSNDDEPLDLLERPTGSIQHARGHTRIRLRLEVRKSSDPLQETAVTSRRGNWLGVRDDFRNWFVRAA
jgi:hypothetical protein